VEAQEEANTQDFSALAAEIQRRYKEGIGVTSQVEVLEFQKLQRSEKKTKRVIDLRNEEGDQGREEA
ncbi:MAG: acyl-CoA synthetase family protein, partial [Desulfitobacteriaceae bacterium]